MVQIPTTLIFVQKKGFVFDVFIQPILNVWSLGRTLRHPVPAGPETATSQLRF